MGWGQVRAGAGVGVEPEVGWVLGRTKGWGGVAVVGRDSEVRGRDQNQGEAGSLSLSPLPLLVPGQVDWRVAANADARQV